MTKYSSLGILVWYLLISAGRDIYRISTKSFVQNYWKDPMFLWNSQAILKIIVDLKSVDDFSKLLHTEAEGRGG